MLGWDDLSGIDKETESSHPELVELGLWNLWGGISFLILSVEVSRMENLD